MPQVNELLQRITSFDRKISAHLAVLSDAHASRSLSLIIAHTGDSLLWLLIASLTLAWGNGIWIDFGWRTTIGTLVTGALTAALKWTFRRRRPPGEGRGFYSRFDPHAFPSGHAGRVACLVVLWAPLLPRWGLMLLTCWVVLVGLARIALQVHFTSDILVGWGIGILTGSALLLAFTSNGANLPGPFFP